MITDTFEKLASALQEAETAKKAYEAVMVKALAKFPELADLEAKKDATSKLATQLDKIAREETIAYYVTTGSLPPIEGVKVSGELKPVLQNEKPLIDALFEADIANARHFRLNYDGIYEDDNAHEIMNTLFSTSAIAWSVKYSVTIPKKKLAGG